MKKVFERILVPLDGSDHSLHALKNAIQIAKSCNAKITLINVYSFTQPVVPTPVTVVGGSAVMVEPISFEVNSKMIELHREVGNKILANGRERVQAKGIQVETLLKEGHTVEEILKTANEGKYDLIVIGARGLSAIKEILLGSVSHGVVIHARCPVLVVK